MPYTSNSRLKDDNFAFTFMLCPWAGHIPHILTLYNNDIVKTTLLTIMVTDCYFKLYFTLLLTNLSPPYFLAFLSCSLKSRAVI